MQKVYYKTNDGYSTTKRTYLNRISGTMFSCYTDLFYYELSTHTKKDNTKVSNTPILNKTDMLAFAIQEFNSQKNPNVVLTDAIYYPGKDIWRFIVADRYWLERYLVDPMEYEGTVPYGYFDVRARTGVRIAEYRYEYMKNKYLEDPYEDVWEEYVE